MGLFQMYKPFIIMCSTSYSYVEDSPDSAFLGIGHIAPDEDRLVLWKQAVHFLFTSGMLRGLLFNYLALITSCIYILL